jgi:hypothetical protein
MATAIALWIVTTALGSVATLSMLDNARNR